MSISQNFPEEGPTLNLNFAGSRTLDPRITFTRTSSATYMGRDGLVKIAPANSARFDHLYNSTTGEVESLGLLIEESRTNLLLRSEEFDNASWIAVRATVTPNSEAAPTGTITADSVTGTDTSPYLQQNLSSGAGTYTLSVYLRAALGNTSNLCRLRINDSVEGLQSGLIFTISQTWQRYSFTVYISGSVNHVRIDITSGDTVYYWGAQLEQGSFPTSYIPTTTSTVTRTADNASITGSNFSDFYNPSEGSILCYFYKKEDPTTFHYFVSLRNTNDTINRMNILASTAFSGMVRGVIINNNVSVADNFTGYIYSRENINKSIFAYKENNTNTSAGGLIVQDDTSCEIPQVINALDIGRYGTLSANCIISQITYYSSRLPNDQLITLTK
jgi:hypothetical protein